MYLDVLYIKPRVLASAYNLFADKFELKINKD